MQLFSKFKSNNTQLEPFKLEQINDGVIDSPLLHFRKDVASQDGEDGIIEAIFSVIKPSNKYCVEFGAWDGKYFSNTWNLIHHKKWSGLLIEGNPQKYQQLESTYTNYPNVICLNRYVGLNDSNSLESLLGEVGAPVNLDLLSIDVDGMDYFIWESVVNYRPKVVVIEFNPSIPNDVIFVQAKSNDINQGCSLLALIQLGRAKGYELICCTGWNAFFVEQAFFQLFPIKDNQIDKLYRPICDGRIFHGYDSTVHITGMSRLIWSQIPVASSNFQVVPKKRRVFADASSRKQR